MRTDSMRQQITAAIEQDKRSGFFRQVLQQTAAMTGHTMTAAAIQEVIDACTEYVSAVPTVLEEADRAAHAAGIGLEFQQFGEAVEQYWFEPHDFIPDYQGLIGYVDDAYVALSVVQGASNQFVLRTGRPLISQDISVANGNVRTLIGEPIVSQLDMIVGNTLAGPTLQTWLNSMMSRVNAFPLDTPHPLYGNASINDIVDTQLGSMGIFPGSRRF